MDEDAESTQELEETYDYADGDERTGEPSAEPDVLLDVPHLKVDEITLDVDDLRARVSLQAEVLDLLKLNVGADVSLGGVHLDIKGVEAQALLKVRLDNVVEVIGRVLTTIDRNPQILEQVTSGLGSAAEELGRGTGRAVDQLGIGAGSAVEDIGEGTGKAAESIGTHAGEAVEDIGESTGKTAESIGEDIGEAAEEAVGTVGKTTGPAVERGGETSDTAGRAVHRAPEETGAARRTREPRAKTGQDSGARPRRPLRRREQERHRSGEQPP